MSTRQDGSAGAAPPIGSKRELVEWIASGAKPKSAWRMGTEHEKFVFDTRSKAPVPYEGANGIKALMLELQRRHGWEPILEGETMIALKRPAGEPAATVSLEPGGQFELSGATLSTLHETDAETAKHLDQVRAIGRELHLGFLGLGFTPDWRLADIPQMPKRRYAVMTGYMPKVGSRGLDMMFRTCTVQVNLDFSSEADMVKKLRLCVALQPIATALFANSPFTEGRKNGLLSARSEIWRDTDNNRAGMMPWAFEDGMGFERYADYALDVPMYFVKRGAVYHDVAGASFRDLLAGKLHALPGERAVMSDWANHLSTIFPEVRLKRYLEMRGADVGPADRITALSALFAGLLYDTQALDAAWDMVKDWSSEERQSLRDDVPRLALDARIAGRSARGLALEMVALARVGLQGKGRDISGAIGDGQDDPVRKRDTAIPAIAGVRLLRQWQSKNQTRRRVAGTRRV